MSLMIFPSLKDDFDKKTSSGEVEHMKMKYGAGLAVSVLFAIVLFLFGVITPLQSVAVALFLVGAWSVGFGLTSYEFDRIYYVGWGAGIAALSTFIFLPLRYVLALVLIVVIALIVFTTAASNSKRRGKTRPSGTSEGKSLTDSSSQGI